MRRWFFGIAIVSLPIFVCSYIGAKWYIGSASFADRASEVVSDILDADVEFKQPFIVESLFPSMSVRIPSGHFKIQSEGQVSRIRIKDTDVKIPLLPLVIKRHARGINLVMGDISIIAQGESSSEFSLAAQIREFPLLWQLMSEMMAHEAKLSVTQLQYLERSQKGTAIERVENVSLRLSPQGISLSFGYVTSEKNMPLSFEFTKDELFEGQAHFVLHGKAKIGAADHTIVSSFSLRTDEDQFSISSLKVGQGANLIEGDLTVTNIADKKDRPQIRGEIVFKRLDLTTLQSPLLTEVRAKKHTTPLFSGNLIPYKVLNEIDTSLTVIAGAVRIGGQPFVNGTFGFTNTQESFSFVSKEAQAMSAPLSFSYVGKKLDDRPYFIITTDLDAVPLERLGAMIGNDGLFDRGTGHLKVKLAFHGEDIQTHARTLDGAVTIVMDNAHLTDGFSKWLDKGIVTHIKGFSAKKQGASSGRDIPCMNVDIEIANGYGIVDESILIETPDNLLISSGFIDLHHENLGFSFRTNSRRMIDWSPLSMVKYMEIGGSLDKPKIKMNEEQVAKKGAMTALSIFAGPIPGLAVSAVSAAKNNKKRRLTCRTI